MQANYRCEECGSRDHPEVHHRTYERLGREWDQDLQVLCNTCHTKHHLRVLNNSPDRVYVALAVSVWRAARCASIADLSEAVKCACVQARMPYNDYQVTRALALLAGRDGFSLTPAVINPAAVAATVPAEPMSRHEVAAYLEQHNLCSWIKVMPSAKPSLIDIYGPVPREPEVEHDYY